MRFENLEDSREREKKKPYIPSSPAANIRTYDRIPGSICTDLAFLKRARIIFRRRSQSRGYGETKPLKTTDTMTGGRGEEEEEEEPGVPLVGEIVSRKRSVLP